MKRDYANDISNVDALRPMDDGTNVTKATRAPDQWKPPATASWCEHATDWASIKIRWSLTVTASERATAREHAFDLLIAAMSSSRRRSVDGDGACRYCAVMNRAVPFSFTASCHDLVRGASSADRRWADHFVTTVACVGGV